ncbi:beta-N-acetylhexosaminidase [Leifsonia sp. 22587]|uniref:beta-N-acetylhexosaminidase n=1 Tax=Leifsonia sp. 22587 TaxID=3453946 RepID=UPI003F830FF7
MFPLIPLPRHLHARSGSFPLHPGDTVAAPPELVRVAALFVRDLVTDGGPALTVALTPAPSAVQLDLSDDALQPLPPAAGVRADGLDQADERYGLEIGADGIRVWGPTAEGVHRGLTTLRQLIAFATSDDETWQVAAAEISDAPRFAWRGLSLDVARCFHPADTVRRVIDMCSLHKINVLHLHLTDDQGWRFSVPGWPALTAESEHYTVEELDDLVAYAAARFVTLVPEADMPGHVSAVFAAYPELRTTPPQIESAAVPIGTLDPDHEPTWRFIDDVVRELAARFPTSAYLHIGGDEAFGMADEAHARFVDRAAAIVKQHGRRVVGWQEISRAGIGAGDIAQFWIDLGDMEQQLSSDAVAAMMPPEFLPVLTEMLAKAEGDTDTALAKGARVLASPASRAYFDRPHAAPSSDPEQEERRGRVGLPVYPAATLRQYVEWDPVDQTPGARDDSDLAGVEAALWCETVTGRDDLEFLLLPRLSGTAEVAWAARATTVWGDYARRLAGQSSIWAARDWSWFRSAEVEWRQVDLPVRVRA